MLSLPRTGRIVWQEGAFDRGGVLSRGLLTGVAKNRGASDRGAIDRTPLTIQTSRALMNWNSGWFRSGAILTRILSTWLYTWPVVFKKTSSVRRTLISSTLCELRKFHNFNNMLCWTFTAEAEKERRPYKVFLGLLSSYMHYRKGKDNNRVTSKI